MRENKQLIIDTEKGDCFRACLTSILGIPNDPTLPDINNPKWKQEWDAFLGQFGLRLVFNIGDVWRSGYWIAGVPSKNYTDSNHAIVMKGTRIAFDPSTKKTYEKGRNIFGSGLVLSGYSLEVMDTSLFPKLEEYKTNNHEHR